MFLLDQYAECASNPCNERTYISAAIRKYGVKDILNEAEELGYEVYHFQELGEDVYICLFSIHNKDFRGIQIDYTFKWVPLIKMTGISIGHDNQLIDSFKFNHPHMIKDIIRADIQRTRGF